MAIAIRPQTDRSFERSSPVARYWLAQCEGFRVAGRVKGTVEQVAGTSDAQRAEVLVVRCALRRHTIPVDDVDTVVPAARLITIGDGDEATKPARVRGRALAHARSRAVPGAASLAGKTAVVARYVADVAFTVLLMVAATLFAFAALLGRGAIYGAHQLTIAVRRLGASVRARRAIVESTRSRTRAPLGRARAARRAETLSRAALLGLGPRAPSDDREHGGKGA